MTLAPVGRSVVDRKMKTEDEEDERRRRRRRHLTRVRERPTDICASFENGGWETRVEKKFFTAKKVFLSEKLLLLRQTRNV